MKRWFHRVVLARLWLTFLVLGLSFFGFGAGTLNLIYLFQANAHLLLNNGWQALTDGVAVHGLPELGGLCGVQNLRTPAVALVG